jgi:hypothetical protein
MTEASGWIRGPGWLGRRSRAGLVIAVLGFTQCLAWGSSVYLLTVLAKPISVDTGWSLTSVVAGLSLGLLIAGLVSPAMGRAVERRGGRPVLALGSVALAVGLAAMGLARGPISYFAAWAVLGIGMAAGLYDAAFATLGHLYGREARRLITNLTLIGGFASTAAWPLSAVLVEALGWRGACFSYAAMHVALGVPMHWLLLPPGAPARHVDAAPGPAPVASTRAGDDPPPRGYRTLVWMLGANFTLQAIISSVMSVHLLAMLQGLGLALATAVGLGTVVGPSQVGGRLLEVGFGRYFHPVWTAVAASAFTLAGVGLLLVADPAVIAIALVLYGAGNGIKTIVKGTLPLAVFGPSGYASLLGRLALPTLIAQAVAPTLLAPTLAGSGPGVLLWILTGIALLNLLLSYALRLVSSGDETAVPAST